MGSRGIKIGRRPVFAGFCFWQGAPLFIEMDMGSTSSQKYFASLVSRYLLWKERIFLTVLYTGKQTGSHKSCFLLEMA